MSGSASGKPELTLFGSFLRYRKLMTIELCMVDHYLQVCKKYTTKFGRKTIISRKISSREENISCTFISVHLLFVIAFSVQQ